MGNSVLSSKEQLCIREIRTVKTRMGHHRYAQLRATQVGIRQRHASKVSRPQVGTFQIRPMEMSTDETDLLEVHPLKICISEINDVSTSEV